MSCDKENNIRTTFEHDSTTEHWVIGDLTKTIGYCHQLTITQTCSCISRPPLVDSVGPANTGPLLHSASNPPMSKHPSDVINQRD